MHYRKFKADYLFTGKEFCIGEKVLITDGAGKIIDITDAKEAGENIEHYEGIIAPGFINTHCHLELSHLKNVIPGKKGLVDFVFKVVTQRHFAEEEIMAAIAKGEEEMITNGIVATGDICNNIDTISQKQLHRLQYYNFIEISGWLPQVAETRFQKGKNYFDAFSLAGLQASIVPHAPYSVSDDLWKKMVPFFEGKTVSIHSQENKEEDLFFMEGKGIFTEMYEMMNLDNSFYTPPKKRSVENYFPKLSTAASVILVHNTFIRQQDIDFIKQHKRAVQLVSFCMCPNANLYIENMLPPVDLLMKNNCEIVLGTDSLASNHQLNILEEIKTILKKYPAIATETLLQWATVNGAKALQAENVLGSFEKGKKPGIILIENTNGTVITQQSTVKNLLIEKK